MVVIVIITVVAALAVPAITRQMKDRRTQEAAQRVAGMYRDARMRAMGRGSAVLVRYTPGNQGRIDMWEAQRGTGDAPTGSSDADCATLPVSSCLTPDWNVGAPGTSYRAITALNLANRGEYDRVNISMIDEAGNGVSALDVCFTPMGRTFFRTTLTQPLQPLASTHTAEVYRAEGSTRIGRTRRVLVMPNGASRLIQ
jgi:type IV fimbrial biogenesis protein FimT